MIQGHIQLLKIHETQLFIAQQLHQDNEAYISSVTGGDVQDSVRMIVRKSFDPPEAQSNN